MQFHNSEQLTPKWTAQKLTHFTGYRDYSSGIAKTTSHIFFKQLLTCTQLQCLQVAIQKKDCWCGYAAFTLWIVSWICSTKALFSRFHKAMQHEKLETMSSFTTCTLPSEFKQPLFKYIYLCGKGTNGALFHQCWSTFCPYYWEQLK